MGKRRFYGNELRSKLYVILNLVPAKGCLPGTRFSVTYNFDLSLFPWKSLVPISHDRLLGSSCPSVCARSWWPPQQNIPRHHLNAVRTDCTSRPPPQPQLRSTNPHVAITAAAKPTPMASCFTRYAKKTPHGRGF